MQVGLRSHRFELTGSHSFQLMLSQFTFFQSISSRFNQSFNKSCKDMTDSRLQKLLPRQSPQICPNSTPLKRQWYTARFLGGVGHQTPGVKGEPPGIALLLTLSREIFEEALMNVWRLDDCWGWMWVSHWEQRRRKYLRTAFCHEHATLTSKVLFCWNKSGLAQREGRKRDEHTRYSYQSIHCMRREIDRWIEEIERVIILWIAWRCVYFVVQQSTQKGPIHRHVVLWWHLSVSQILIDPSYLPAEWQDSLWIDCE